MGRTPRTHTIAGYGSLNAFRQYLLQQMYDHRGFVVIETGGGFHGEHLVNLFADGFEPAQVERLSDPDDVDHNMVPELALIHAPLVSGLRGWRDTVAARAALGKHTVVVLPQGVSSDAMRRESTRPLVLTGAELVYRLDDVVALLAEAFSSQESPPARPMVDGIAEIILQMSEGWPDYVHACIHHVLGLRSAAVTNPAVFAQVAFRSRVVTPHLDAFDRASVAAMAQLAHFGSVTPTAATAIGGLDFSETALPHAPGVLRTTSGLLRFVEPVRRHLSSLHPLDPATAEIVAPVLAAEGELTSAATKLIAAGLDQVAADLICSLDDVVTDRCNQRELVAILKTLVDRYGEHRPKLALKLANTHWNLVEISESVQTCERALGQAAEGSADWFVLQVEQLWYRHLQDLPIAESQRQVTWLWEQFDDIDGLERRDLVANRLREVEAYVASQSQDPADVVRAVGLFKEVAAVLEQHGQDHRAARTLRNLASICLHGLGRYRDGQRALERAASLCLDHVYDHGQTMLLKARFDALAGDFDSLEQSVRVARLMVEAAGREHLDAHLMLAEMIAAGWKGELAEVERCYRGVRSKLGPQAYQTTLLMVYTLAAEAFAMAGDLGQAAEVLDSVRPLAEWSPADLGAAEIVIAARRGDPAAAQAILDEIVEQNVLPADRQWRYRLEIELARGSQADRGVMAAAIRDAERLGLSDLPGLIAPYSMLPVPVGPDLNVGPRIDILGTFSVRAANGDPARFKPTSREGTLLTLLALAGGGVATEQAADELWPGDPRGTQRIRNVLSRIRAELGDEALVRDGHNLRLGPQVSSDVADFDRLATKAVAAKRTGPGAARRAATEALELCGRPLREVGSSERVRDAMAELAARAEALLDYLVEVHHPHHAWVLETRQRLGLASP